MTEEPSRFVFLCCGGGRVVTRGIYRDDTGLRTGRGWVVVVVCVCVWGGVLKKLAASEKLTQSGSVFTGSGSSLAATGKRIFRLREMNEHAAQLITLFA